MKAVHIALIPLVALAGCTSVGTSANLARTQFLGYPELRPAVLESAETTGSIQPASEQPAPVAPAAPAVPAASPLAEASPVAPPAAEAPVYDMSRDPYVTAVLLPPVGGDDAPQRRSGPYKRAALPSSARLAVIDVRDSQTILGEANP